MPAATAGVSTSAEQPTTLFSVDASAQNRGTQAVTLPDAPVRTSVHLQEAVDAVRATFTAANHAGISSARISLTPASLGGIKISLTQTPDGLVARVATDHPETAQTLQQSAGDLRRSLEAGGMTLLRLDIGSSGQQSLPGFTGSDQNGSQSGGSGGDWSSVPSDTGDGDEIPTPTELTIELASGSLVNVLA
jgi:flagellar hook-length control protein FliK